MQRCQMEMVMGRGGGGIRGVIKSAKTPRGASRKINFKASSKLLLCTPLRKFPATCTFTARCVEMEIKYDRIYSHLKLQILNKSQVYIVEC